MGIGDKKFPRGLLQTSWRVIFKGAFCQCARVSGPALEEKTPLDEGMKWDLSARFNHQPWDGAHLKATSWWRSQPRYECVRVSGDRSLYWLTIDCVKSTPLSPWSFFFMNITAKLPQPWGFLPPKWNADIANEQSVSKKLCWFCWIVLAIKRLLEVTTFLFDIKWSIADNAMYFFILKSSKVH